MPKTMLLRQLGRLFTLAWGRMIQYRGDLLAWLTAITAGPLLSLAIWHSVAANSAGGLSARDILTYFVIIMFVRGLVTVGRGFRLIQEILNGEIVSFLIRPRAMLAEFLITPLVVKILQLAIPTVLLFIALAAWPQAFTPAIYQVPNIALFMLSLFLAFLMSFAFDISMGMLAFWLEDAQEIMAYRVWLTQVASGVVIPFALMPDWLFTTFSLLPFRYMASAPVEILMGQVVSAGAWQLIGIQFAWAVGFTAILRFMYARGLKRYDIPGQ